MFAVRILNDLDLAACFDGRLHLSDIPDKYAAVVNYTEKYSIL